MFNMSQSVARARPFFCRLLVAACLGLAWSAAPRLARAGGGPENAFVVVNADSWASLALANEFIHLRGVPARNVLYISPTPYFDTMPVEEFRGRVLKPVLDAIAARGLASQIDYVIYSSDVPTEIDITSDVTKEAVATLPSPDNKTVTNSGSLSGLTYLHSLVLAKDVRYASLRSNAYFRPIMRRDGRIVSLPSTAFRSSLGWEANGAPAMPGQGARYMLSAVLGFTSGRGNSVSEALNVLRRGASADGNGPKGTIYFLRNSDVRSKVRQDLFEPAVAALGELGISAKVVDGVLPQEKADVAGLMTGAADFNWRSSRSAILPGAICDHFTSWGGVLKEYTEQTPLTEFLRAGAAGACGTVIEPYAIPSKFPTPFIHAHYARGCSLAEAFYQSVAAPYQLLIVGDPLCQPWAKFPRVKAEVKNESGADVQPGSPVSGKLAIRPAVEQKDMEIAHYELFVDGLRKAEAEPNNPLDLDTAGLEEGWHEIRVVAVAREQPQTRGRTIFPIVVSRGGPKLAVTPPKESGVSWDSAFSISADLPGAKKILFLHNGREVGAIAGAGGAAKLDLRAIGQGQALVQPVGVLAGKDGGEVRVPGKPVAIEVRPPMPTVPPPAPPEASLAKGVLVILSDGRKVVVNKYAHDWLPACGVKKDEPFEIQACLSAADDDTYQLQIRAGAPVSVELNSRQVGAAAAGEWRFIPLSLAKGMHRLSIKGKGVAGILMDVRFGGPGAKSIVNTAQHVRAGEVPPR
jgi:hypothetical protein